MEIKMSTLEKYLYERYSGWTNEQGLFLGEVAEVINMRNGSKLADGSDLSKALGEELCDMVHYIVAIAAINKIDLTKTMLEKDKVASKKYNHDTNLESYIINNEK